MKGMKSTTHLEEVQSPPAQALRHSTPRLERRDAPDAPRLRVRLELLRDSSGVDGADVGADALDRLVDENRRCVESVAGDLRGHRISI